MLTLIFVVAFIYLCCTRGAWFAIKVALLWAVILGAGAIVVLL